MCGWYKVLGLLYRLSFLNSHVSLPNEHLVDGSNVFWNLQAVIGQMAGQRITHYFLSGNRN